jgi:hypothetical protein
MIRIERLGKRLIIFTLLVMLGFGCASQKHNKKLKPGKPIPCPQKDC